MRRSLIQEDRGTAERRLAAILSEVTALQDEIAAHGACDPAVVDAKRQAASLAHEAVIRWTGT